MKTKFTINHISILLRITLLFCLSLNSYAAINYSVSFTGSGLSTTVGNVIVQNLTKGTTVTVPTGSILKLTDVTSSINNLKTDNEVLSIYPNPIQSNATLTFNAENSGIAQLKVYTLDGRTVASISTNVQQGKNLFKLSLPEGIFNIQISGNGFLYNAKAISQSTNSQAQISAFGFGNVTQLVKAKSSETSEITMHYSTGDQLLYKGISGNYTTVVMDKPTGNKTVNFKFVECKDADNNNYSVVTIGTQTWIVENLKSTHYNDGSQITIQYHPNDINLEYGPSYAWNDIIKPNFAPKGWHVPTNSEWKELYDSISTLGVKLKEVGTNHWNTDNGTNETGFTALGSAHIYGASLKDETTWWSLTENSASEAIRWSLFDNGNFGSTSNDKSMRFNVRLIKDDYKDIDNNTYSAVIIGKQTWMVENFKSTHFTDGTEITVQYHSDDVNKEYGPSYSWNDITNPKFAPKGWHVPTDAEWSELSTTISTLGVKLKETGTTHWNTDNGTNETGFTALGSAHVYGASLKAETTWWSSTENSASDGIRWALFDNGILGRAANDKSMRFTVRLIKDK